MHLFSNIKYELSGQEIESLYYPGQATTMLGLLKYPDDFQKSQGLNQLWYKDMGATAHLTNNLGFGVRHGYLIKSPDPKGTFSFRIPFKHIFGFAEDYDNNNNRFLYSAFPKLGSKRLHSVLLPRSYYSDSGTKQFCTQSALSPLIMV